MKRFLSKFEFGVLALLVGGFFAKATKAADSWSSPYGEGSYLDVAQGAAYATGGSHELLY